MQPNPYLMQNQIPLPVPNLPLNPFLHLNPAISQEIIQQFIAMSFNTPNVLASIANMGDDEGPSCNPKMRRGDLLKSVSMDSTEDPPSITLDNNGDMIVPNNDKEGWYMKGLDPLTLIFFQVGVATRSISNRRRTVTCVLFVERFMVDTTRCLTTLPSTIGILQSSK